MSPPSYRTVYSLLGLPFDLLDLEGAVRAIQSTAAGQPTAVLSTPNVNWVIMARDHAALRDSVLVSRMSVVDGKPLVWLGRLLGIPWTQRVSGADVFLRMQRAGPGWRIFFFGGLGDVAERASARLNAEAGVLTGVGGLNPGKGSLDEMSRPEILAHVRAAAPDLLVVSLGALRGQAWILRNLPALQARWVTHLGAVVNFVAGEVRRAPLWMQRLALEWVWRIVQEPALWRRYAGDGVRLSGLLMGRTLPLLFWQAWYRRAGVPASDALSAADEGMPSAGSCVALRGCWDDLLAPRLHAVLEAQDARLTAQHGIHALPLCLDLQGVRYLGPAVMGQLMIWRGHLLLSGRSLQLRNPSLAVQRLLHGHAAEYLLRD